MMIVKDKRVVVIGLGETGLSVLRWLVAHGANVSVVDTRENPPNADAVKEKMPQVDMYLGALEADQLAAADLLVVSPGVAMTEPAIEAAVNAGVPAVGDVELFAQYRPGSAKVIAITGSNGKSTVTTLVGEMCKAAGLKTIVAGNIGIPVLDTLSMDAPDVYVLELSSFQLETTATLAVDAAAVLNLSEDHLDRYADMTAYAAAKARIFHNAKVQVLNRDDAWSMVMARPSLTMRTFGLTSDQQEFNVEEIEGESWLCEGRRRLVKVSDVHIKGMHNMTNVLAALALCRSIGLEYAPLIKALKDFKGLPHRVQWVANVAGVDYFDDSKGTNVGATCAAIAGMPQTVVLIAGGDGKGQDFTPLQTPVRENVRVVVLIGRDAPAIEQVLVDTEVPIYYAQDMHEAVMIAKRTASMGDAVLLSPACASFDMYKNYIERAEAFVDVVMQQEEVAC